MKKLGKLTISPEKIMKYEELINLQGGYQGWCCQCNTGIFMGGVDEGGCHQACKDAGYHGGVWVC